MKKLTFLFIVVISLSLISAVHANDNQTGNLVQNASEIHYFDELSEKINQSDDTLTLDCDYEYKNTSNHGIVISKPITIDGAGHTLDGKKSSRIFNITSDNVTVKNIIFKNGNALGFYSTYYGGGAIYWNGSNGTLINCTFMDNSATGLEFDPYAQGDIVHYGDDGISWVEYNIRPTGASTNQGGAVTWMGDDGHISGCIFKNNHVAYPDDGGAVLWAGNNGEISESKFFYNTAYRGSAVYWRGDNGTIARSCFLNDGICDSGIFWTGKNGRVKTSILLKTGSVSVISPYSTPVDADFNFWGDTVENPNKVEKPDVNNWVLVDIKPDRDFVFEGEQFNVCYNLNKLIFTSNKTYTFYGMANGTGSVKYVAEKSGFVNAIFDANSIKVEILDYDLSDDFIELAQRIRDTPEGGVLMLDKNYSYVAGPNSGILISKSITIDGNGFTLNGQNISRIFNITADNVTVKNIDFINGNAYGRYYATYVGGGAIYWSGNNGYLENCRFNDNHGNGIEDDPFDGEEEVMAENGLVMVKISMRPMGARTNEGGAIVWNGTDGTVKNCVFTNNSVGYPNCGGAIFWRGENGKIINSQFYDNWAWLASAVYWKGDNGLISHSKFLNSGLRDSGILWSGTNGTIEYSILLSNGGRYVVNQFCENLTADYNFWGDTIDNPDRYAKVSDVQWWYTIASDDFSVSDLEIDDSFVLHQKQSGFEVIDEVIVPAKIQSQDLIKYYKSSKQFRVQILDKSGKTLNGQRVTFKINDHEMNVKTDGKGFATLTINQKPGKYTVHIVCGNLIVKNRITVKKTLITKNLSKKVGNSAKFKVKVLNSKGKPYSNRIVKIKFKGKIYNLKTNNKGIATFKIPKNLKVGKYTIKTTFNGLTISNRIIVKK